MSRLKNRGPWMLATVALLATAVGAGVANLQNGANGQTSKSPRDAAAISQAKSFSNAFRYAAEQAGPSVVKIRVHTAAKKVKGMTRETPFGGHNPFKGTPFEDMIPDDGQAFGGMGNFGSPERDGVGSGVIIDKSGVVLTNNHVVQDADEVIVTLGDGREFKGTDIKTDPQTDLAVIRIHDAKDLPVAKLGNSDELEIGDWVLAIGCPFELDHTVSAGIISGKGRELSDGNHASFLQTDAAINPGNSGGPLVNIDGEVVGINTAIATNSGGYQGIGFSIPINTAKWVTSQLIDKGSVSRSYLGVGLRRNRLRPGRRSSAYTTAKACSWPRSCQTPRQPRPASRKGMSSPASPARRSTACTTCVTWSRRRRSDRSRRCKSIATASRSRWT